MIVQISQPVTTRLKTVPEMESKLDLVWRSSERRHIDVQEANWVATRDEFTGRDARGDPEDEVVYVDLHRMSVRCSRH